jgi:hypothetical protein
LKVKGRSADPAYGAEWFIAPHWGDFAFSFSLSSLGLAAYWVRWNGIANAEFNRGTL